MELMDISELKVELEALHVASFGWALSCCRGDRAEAEEVLQTVYLKIVEGKARYRAEASLKTWLFAVIRKTAISEHRRRLLRTLRFSESPNDFGDETSMQPGQDALLETSELRSRFRNALNKLPARQRQVLHLVFYEDLTLREAANVMSVSIGSARQHYERGKKRLRETLEKTGPAYGNMWRRNDIPDVVL